MSSDTPQNGTPAPPTTTVRGANVGTGGQLFELTTFLNGHTRAWGVFEDRFGRLRRRFDVEMTGAWREGVFVLDESFVYDDGRTERRRWTVSPTANGRFRAACADCIGEASGQCSSDMVRMIYKFRLRLPSRDLTVDFRDRIYRMSDRTAVNRATISKWGIKLGELSLFFERSHPLP